MTYFEFHKHIDASFEIMPVSLGVIASTIAELKSNAEGYDGVSLNMLILTLPYTLPYITGLINRSIETSTFPDAWKIAAVRPIPKTANPINIKDLRPIIILPCLSKVMEKVVCKQLTEYLEKYNILPDLQSGFRKRRGTATALIDVTDNILAAQDRGMCTVLVLLDFSRAFDGIHTGLLLSKLRYYGVDQGALSWFHSYLDGRKQMVVLKASDGNDIASHLASIGRGVPQGSILGPILFSLYCADITNCLKNCQYHIYADDVQVYLSFNPGEHGAAVAKLNDDLKRITTWAESNCLLLNPHKTKYLLFGTKTQISRVPTSLNLSLMGELIDRVTEARNLGLYVDPSLRFEKHIAESVRNCFYRLKVLYKMRPHLSEELRVHVTESLVLSKLNYADVVYGPRLLARTERLVQRVQNACARFCFAIPHRSHVTPYLSNYSLLKMKTRRKMHMACLLFGVIRCGEPRYLFDKLGWVTSRRLCARRQCSQQLSIQQHRSASFRGSFRYAASKIWNNLPPPLRSITTITTFRKRLRLFLLEAQRRLDNVNANISLI